MRFDPAHFRFAVGEQAPVWPFDLDPLEPLGAGLIGAWPMLVPGVATGLATAGKFTGGFKNDGAIAASPGGYALGGLTGESSNASGFLIDDDDRLDLGDNFTIGLEIYLNGTGHGDARVIDKEDETGNTGFMISLNSGRWYMRFNDTTFIQVPVANSLALKKWYRIMATLEDSDAAALYINGAQVQTATGMGAPAANALGLAVGHRIPANDRGVDGFIRDVRIWDRALSPGEAWRYYDPATRWALYRAALVPRAWPAAGGALGRTATGSLQAALRRQVGLQAALNAATRAARTLTASGGAAVSRTPLRNNTFDAAVQAIVSAQADLDAALTRSLLAGSGLDAHVTLQGLSQRLATLDGAVRRLNARSGALEAALRGEKLDSAPMDAGLANLVQDTVGLDAAARRGVELPTQMLEAAMRATAGRAAALDAIVGAIVAASAGRTFGVAADRRHAAVTDRRQAEIPADNRRH